MIRELPAVLAVLFVIGLLVTPLPAMSNSWPHSPNADLIAAVERSDLAGVRAALRRGATGDATDLKGRTVCRLAVERGDLEIVKLLSGNSHAFAKSRDGETALSRAVELHRPDLWKAILTENSSEDFGDETTPLLFWAAFMDDSATVRVLLSRPGGAQDKEAGAALLIAAGYG